MRFLSRVRESGSEKVISRKRGWTEDSRSGIGLRRSSSYGSESCMNSSSWSDGDGSPAA